MRDPSDGREADCRNGPSPCVPRQEQESDPSARTGTPAETSADRTVQRFDNPQSAHKYAASLTGTPKHERETGPPMGCAISANGTPKHERETGCIMKLLAGLPAGANVLDLPCGTGRLLPLLVGAGFQVTAADSSGHMLDLARQHCRQTGRGSMAPNAKHGTECKNVSETRPKPFPKPPGPVKKPPESPWNPGFVTFVVQKPMQTSGLTPA